MTTGMLTVKLPAMVSYLNAIVALLLSGYLSLHSTFKQTFFIQSHPFIIGPIIAIHFCYSDKVNLQANFDIKDNQLKQFHD